MDTLEGLCLGVFATALGVVVSVAAFVWLKHFWDERTSRDRQILESWAEICHSPTSLKNLGKELTELRQELAALRKKLEG
jgi:transposase-like protein